MYKEKYIKYKIKYTALKNQLGGGVIIYTNKTDLENLKNGDQIKINTDIGVNNFNLTLIIHYNLDNFIISLDNITRNRNDWTVVLSNNHNIDLDMNDKSTELVNNIKFHIAWIDKKETQLQLYNIIDNYLEKFLDSNMQEKLSDVKEIAKHVQLLTSVKTKITELIITIKQKDDETFNAYVKEAKENYLKWKNDD